MIIREMEDILWQIGLLGDHSPQVLIDMMVYLIRFCFTLRSGEEHRHLWHEPSQFSLVEHLRRVPYIVDSEDISKTNQGGLNSRNLF